MAMNSTPEDQALSAAIFDLVGRKHIPLEPCCTDSSVELAKALLSVNHYNDQELEALADTNVATLITTLENA